MKNRLIIPDNSPFSPAQRSKIRDVWALPPIGLRALSGNSEFPDLVVSPNFSVGKYGNIDTRGVTLKPQDGLRYELVVVNSVPDYQPSNPRIKSHEIKVERRMFFMELGTKEDRYSLTTMVAPTRCETTYKAVIDVDPAQIDGLKTGRIWASENVLEREEQIWRLALEHPRDFF